MREAVNVVLKSGEKIFMIKRQNYLLAFPGYHSFPGGKVDKGDEKHSFPVATELEEYIIGACRRELQEELNFDLAEAKQSGLLTGHEFLGVAHTPSFNPHRFKSYFVLFELSEEVGFELDSNEASYGAWMTPSEFLGEYNKGDLLA